MYEDTHVYKLTRSDGFEYIGITKNFNKRVKQHSKSSRFKQGIVNKEILYTCISRDHAEYMERYYIEVYDTFYNGLNNTVDGGYSRKGSNVSTNGYVYSETSRKRMVENHWSKTGKYYPKGIKHSEETKKLFSKIRKGKVHSSKYKFTKEFIEKLINEYNSKSRNIDPIFVLDRIKKSQLTYVNEENVIEYLLSCKLITKGGQVLTYHNIYCKHVADEVGCTPVHISNIINGKTLYTSS